MILRDASYAMRRQGASRTLNGQNGFSLLELVIGLAMATIVLAGIIGVFTTLTRSYTTQNVAADVQQTARVGIDYIAQEVRMAGLNPQGGIGANAASIEEISATGTKLRFTMDRCDNDAGCDNPAPDGDLDDNSERITYFYDPANSALKRCLYEPAGTESPTSVVFVTTPKATTCQTIIDNVVPNPDGSPLFRFLDDDDPPNTITNNSDRSQIRTVVITLTIQESAGRDAPVSRMYSTRVRCRNIGL
jgi:Tfp pilus assembly protein PilW